VYLQPEFPRTFSIFPNYNRIMRTIQILPIVCLLSTTVVGQMDDNMGPAAVLWPSDRAFSEANDNTAPCGSAAGVSNRTDFPMSMYSLERIWS